MLTSLSYTSEMTGCQCSEKLNLLIIGHIERLLKQRLGQIVCSWPRNILFASCSAVTP